MPELTPIQTKLVVKTKGKNIVLIQERLNEMARVSFILIKILSLIFNLNI
jgi:hypothetical protein